MQASTVAVVVVVEVVAVVAFWISVSLIPRKREGSRISNQKGHSKPRINTQRGAFVFENSGDTIPLRSYSVCVCVREYCGRHNSHPEKPACSQLQNGTRLSDGGRNIKQETLQRRTRDGKLWQT